MISAPSVIRLARHSFLAPNFELFRAEFGNLDTQPLPRVHGHDDHGRFALPKRAEARKPVLLEQAVRDPDAW